MEDDQLQLKRGILMEAIKGMVAFLFQRSVGIAIIKNNRLTNTGSGTCIQVGDRYFVATAAHVIASSQKEEIWLIHQTAPTENQIPILACGTRGGTANEDDIDVGWIELEGNTAIGLNKTFIQLAQIQPNVAFVENDLVVINGYPGALVNKQLLKLRELSVQSIAYHTVTLPKSEWPNGKQEAFDIITNYPSDGNILTDGTPYSLPDAPGISGGGIWSMNITTAGLWSPMSAQLIGVFRSWSDSHRWGRGTQIQHWLKLISDSHPELEDVVNELLTA